MKWPGGKRWLSARLSRAINQVLERSYIEPFLGGGAVFFSLCPQRAFLADINEEIINTYKQVRDNASNLTRSLGGIPVDERTYYKIRTQKPRSNFQRAVRFLYLNRTAFSGMYRLNRDGNFNVPYGGGERTPETLLRRGLLISASNALDGISLVVKDFEPTIDRAGPGDVVYCDPTYTVAHNKNAFVRYNERNFSWADQERLVSSARRARARGAVVVVSNAAHESVASLYWPSRPIVLRRPSSVSRKQNGRGPVDEYLFLMLPSNLKHRRSALVSSLTD